jgi:hypothetical protein
MKSLPCKINFMQKNLVCETHIRYFAYIRIYMISDHVESNMTSLPFSRFRTVMRTCTLCPFLILPTAMPTTAHFRNYMISDHVESNIRISL